MGEASPQKPLPRASHSAAYFNNKLYIFGGMNEDNNKFSDLWELDLASGVYKEIVLPATAP